MVAWVTHDLDYLSRIHRCEGLEDRDRQSTYLVVAEFETYELAMEKPARPETDAFAKQMAELSDGPPAFANYDLIHEDTA